jgi:tetratricopeptide (TPR) repeat protein
MINKDKRRSTSNRYLSLSPARKFHLCSITAIFLLTLTVYANSLNNDFTNWDDPGLVIENPSIRSLDPANIIDIFVPKAGHSYQPVRVLSYAVDYHLWKLNPVGYHGVNILLHALSALLLYLMLSAALPPIRPEGRDGSNRIISLITTVLFVVHPVNVEAVTWISSRKYGLLAFFSFLSFYLYILSRREQKINTSYYLSSLGAYLLALLSSPFALTFPGLLFLYDFCRASISSPLRVLKKHIFYYLPYCLLALLYFFILWSSLRSGADNTVKDHYMNQPFYTFLTMLSVIFDYLRNISLPLWLNNRYIDNLHLNLVNIKIFISIIIIVVTLIVVLSKARTGSKLPLFCTGWFFICWLPAANIIPVSTKMADRYLYLSAVGLFLLFSVWIVKLAGDNYRKARAVVVFSFCTLLILSFSILTIQRNKVWANSLTLWEDSLRKAPNSRIAHLNLGEVLDEQGKLEEAIAHYREALRIDPYFARAHNNLGVALAKQGKVEEAINHYLEALRLNRNLQKTRLNLDDALDLHLAEQDQTTSTGGSLVISPEYVKSLSNLGVALALMGKYDQAVAYCKKALELQPQWPEGLNNLGNVMAAQSKFDEAVQYLSLALELKPDYADAHNNLAVIYARLGQFAKASTHYSEALDLKPHSAEIHNNLGVALAAQGKLDKALQHYIRAVELRPEYAEAHMNLGNALSYQGDLQRGTVHLKRALAIDSSSPEIHNNLGVAFARQGKLDEAIVHFREALRLRPSYEQAQLNLQIALDEKKEGKG